MKKLTVNGAAKIMVFIEAVILISFIVIAIKSI